MAKEGELGLEGELVFPGFKILETILIIYKPHILIFTQKLDFNKDFKIYLVCNLFRVIVLKVFIVHTA